MLIRVRATLDDPHDSFAVAAKDLAARFFPTLVLDGVVQQRGDRLLLVGTVLERDPRHPQQMGYVGGARYLPNLAGVQAACVNQRCRETFG